MQLDFASQDAFVFFQPETEVDESQEEPQAMLQEPEELIEHILSSGATPVHNDQEVQRDMEEQPNPLAMQAAPGMQVDQEVEQKPIPEQEEIQEEQQKQEVAQPVKEEQKTAPIEQKDDLENTALQSMIETAQEENTPHEEEKPEEPSAEMTEDPIQETIAEAVRPTPKLKPQEQQTFGISLGQIAQGFLKSVQQEEGLNNPPHMDADKLVAHQYATKVWNIIKNSFKADANMLHLSQSVDTLAYLVITLTKRGELIDIHLEANSINLAFRQIESLITTHAKKAGLFPPLPKRFNVAQKTFTFPIHIQGQEGYHSYRLSYGRS